MLLNTDTTIHQYKILANLGREDRPPVLWLGLFNDSAKLTLADFGGFTSLALNEGLPNTEDDLESGIQSCSGLQSDDFVGLMEDGAALRVT